MVNYIVLLGVFARFSLCGCAILMKYGSIQGKVATKMHKNCHFLYIKTHIYHLMIVICVATLLKSVTKVVKNATFSAIWRCICASYELHLSNLCEPEIAYLPTYEW